MKIYDAKKKLKRLNIALNLKTKLIYSKPRNIYNTRYYFG